MSETGSVLSGASKQFGRFFGLFGSAAGVAAFLLFAGFLSDFAMYRQAGLPRLSLTPTSLIESGAGVIIDALASSVGSSWRSGTLIAGFLILVSTWASRERDGAKALLASPLFYHLARFATLLLSFSILSAQIEFADRGIHGTEGKEGLAESALRRAYARDFPTPRERLREMERSSYELSFYPLPNWAEYHLDKASQTRRTDWQEPAGIAFRVLPESREAAGHVFGWLVLSVVGLVCLIVLMPVWKIYLDRHAGWRSPRPRRVWEVWRRPGIAEHDWLPLSSPTHYLVTPITLLFCVLSLAVLPLVHGLLARNSVGHETVLVFLRDPKLGTIMTATCRKTAAMDAKGLAYADALRDLLQTRSSEFERAATRSKVREGIAEMAQAAMDARCRQALTRFLELRPPLGLARLEPELAADFNAATQEVLTAYHARVGTILAYPRESEQIALVDSILPQSSTSEGQWSLTSLDRAEIDVIEVLPDLLPDRAHRQNAELEERAGSHADQEAIRRLTASRDPSALASSVSLLEQAAPSFHASAAAIEALGGMVLANATNRPDLATRAVDFLAQVLRGSSEVGELKRLRSSAATSLYLTRSPYAGDVLARAISTAPTDCQRKGGDLSISLRCEGAVIDASGFLLEDLVREAALFGEQVPKSVQTPIGVLVAYLVDVAESGSRPDRQRAAACSALVQSGLHDLGEQTARYLKAVAAMTAADQEALPVCVQAIGFIRIEQGRPYLRRLINAPSGSEGDAATAQAARAQALDSLYELGMRGEAAALFEAFTNGDAPARNEARSFLGYVDGNDLGKLLERCVSSNLAQDPRLAWQCLIGLPLTNKEYDGDRGGTAIIAQVFADSKARHLWPFACAALKEFSKRGGQLAGGVGLPPDAAKACPPDVKTPQGPTP